jgi:hypothetical protein
MAAKQNKSDDRRAGLVPEDEFIARTTSNVPRPESEERARASFASGMRFHTLCSRYGLRPEAALRILGVEKNHIDESEWYWACLHYSDSDKQLTRNPLRGGGEPRIATGRYRDVTDNPVRGSRA